MLAQLHYTVSKNILQDAINSVPSTEFRLTINKPTGNFFYDPWEIKPEFQNTPWSKMLEALNTPVGEARIILLAPGTCYHAHADIDDRYHLNISGNNAYLIDLDKDQMHKLQQDGHWYLMDAGRIHSAVNFGFETRIQLVVRKLLDKNTLKDPVRIKIYWEVLAYERARSLLDNHLSGWLNQQNKIGSISNFSFTMTDVTFDVEQSLISNIEERLPEHFKIEYL